MAIGRLSRQAGFTRLEFAVVAAVFGLLVAAFAERVLVYNAQAEQVAVRHLTAALRTALQVRTSQLGGNGNVAAMTALTQENPLGWLVEKPANYLGEFYSPKVEDLPHGNWLFDRADRCLVYIPDTHKTFSFETSELLKFKVKFVHLSDSLDRSGRSKTNQGLILDQVDDDAAVKSK